MKIAARSRVFKLTLVLVRLDHPGSLFAWGTGMKTLRTFWLAFSAPNRVKARHIRMKARQFLEEQLAKLDAPRQKAIRLAQFGERTVGDIAQATGLTEKEVVEAVNGFNEQCDKELAAMVQAGLRIEDVDWKNVRLDHNTKTS